MNLKDSLTADEVAKIIKKLHRLAKKDELEVEDLLTLLKTPDTKFITPLQQMAKEYDWQADNDRLIIPFATWVETVCLYFEKGIEGFIQAAKVKDRFAQFVLSALPELPILESLPAFVEIANVFEPTIKPKDKDFVQKYANALCDTAHLLKNQSISQELQRQLIDILKKLICFADEVADENIKIWALVPFRYIGTLADIDFIQNICFSEKYKVGTEKIIIKDIKKRFK